MMDISASILKRLCSQVTGLSNERVLEHYQLAVTLLNEDLGGETTLSFETIENQIELWLNHENRSQDAKKISNLLKKVKQSKILKNKSSILCLFLYLRQQRTRSSSSQSESEASLSSCFGMSNPFGLVNGYGNEHLQTPSLHSSTSKASSDSPQSNGAAFHPQERDAHPASSLIRDKREGRVARLAAMYKEGAKNYLEGSGHLHLPPKGIAVPTHPHPSKKTRGKETRTKVPDDVILREVLFAFQGIEGKVIKLNAAESSAVIDPQVLLSEGEKDSLLKLAELGWLHNRIKHFCECHSSRTPCGGTTALLHGSSLHTMSGVGLVNQSLIMVLKEELNEYCRLIAVLETQVQDSETNRSSGESSLVLTLRRLLLWTVEPRARLRTLCMLTHAAMAVKGGSCISEIYKHLHHGDPSHIAVVRNVLSQACRPLFVMLTEWLLDGTLQDPHHEFFIAADPTVSDDKMWHLKYDIRWCMLPTFLSKSQAHSILAVGKSHNFLRSVCNFKGPISEREAIKKVLLETTVESMFEHNESNKLDDLISLTFRTTSSHVLTEILSHHKLLDHLRALRRYLLLGQGDFIHCLLEILEPELCRPAGMLHRHNLTSLLENAVMASNAQFEEPDILKRLDVSLMQHSPGEVGWDVFSLDYHVDGPIGTVFTPDCMQQYLTLFISLWKAKHMEWILSSMWKQQATTSKMCRALPELGGTLHRMQLLLTEMIHLVHQMAYYMTFEVLECSWHLFMKQLKSSQSLDEVINAHHQFLKRTNAGALLDEDSREVRTHLRSLYDPMIRLEALQERLSNAVIAELAARRASRQEIEERTARKEFGTSAETEEREARRVFEFTNTFVPNINRDLQILTKSYQDLVQEFLLMLTQDEDENLNLLCSRIDFNRHYYQRDHRLNLRLTYLHKRKSMGASFCQ